MESRFSIPEHPPIELHLSGWPAVSVFQLDYNRTRVVIGDGDESIDGFGEDRDAAIIAALGRRWPDIEFHFEPALMPGEPK